MDMLKYIAKRLLLAIFILLGVSIIIYTLIRIMPVDFIDNKYSSAVTQGTMRQEDVDHIKELYGMAMPDAYLTVKVGDGSEYSGCSFTKNTKEKTKSDVDDWGKSLANLYSDLNKEGITDEEKATIEGDIAYTRKGYDEIYSKWYVGYYDGKNDTRLYLNDDGTFQIGTVGSTEMVVDDDSDEQDSELVLSDGDFVAKESGTYEILFDSQNADKIRGIVLIFKGQRISGDVSFKLATGWNKFSAILKGYFGWLGNMLKGDLGVSFLYKKPVGEVIKQYMGISFIIAFIATILQFLIAIPLGIKAAVNQYGVVDYTVTVFTMIGISLPTFFLASLFIRLFAVELGWFEVGGLESASLAVGASTMVRLGDWLWHLILPMAVLVILSIGSLMRYTRTNTLEALNADYVRTARAKGLSERTVIYKHAFRNTMIPLVTMMAGILPGLFSGAMITETVFSIPGIGLQAYNALKAADVPFIMGYNMFIAVLTVIGTLLSDLMYAIVDPRVKLS